MKILIQTFLFFFFLNSVFSQQGHFCPTDQAPIMERLIQNKAFLKTNGLPERKADYYIPIIFHLIADSSGNFRATERDVFNLLCRVNEDFEDIGIVFYSKSVPIQINNQTLTEDFMEGVRGSLIDSFSRDSVINIFVTKQSGFNNTVWQSITFAGEDWVAIQNNVAEETSHYLSHELGHFFGLPHTSLGWGRQPLIGITQVPEIDQLGHPTEYQDGTNCDIGGDRICDTPPDYFAFSPAGCDYDGGIQDPSSTPINPMEENMMSSFVQCDNHQFTPNQFKLIEVDYLNSRNDYLRSNLTPTATGTPSQPLLISPIGGVSFGTDRLIFFEWEAAISGSNYIFEISVLPSFQIIEQTISTTSTSLFVENLANGQRYYWRVTAISQTGCTSISEATMIQEKSFSTNIEIYQLGGKRVYIQPHDFKIGINNFSIPTVNLSTGISILKIKTPDGILVEKVILE